MPSSSNIIDRLRRAKMLCVAQELFSGFPHGCAGLRALTRGALRSSERRWTDEWASAGLPHFSTPKKEA